MDSKSRKKLFKIGEQIYSETDLYFSKLLIEQIETLNLTNSYISTAFFLRANTGNDNTRTLISNNFGTEIPDRIELLQRLGNISFPETKKQISNLRKLFVELVDDLALIFIKLSERLLTLKMEEEKSTDILTGIADECLHLYSPIAHRLGIRVIYTQMDDISFKHLYPNDYKRLYKAIEKRRNKLELRLSEMSLDIKAKLKKYNLNANVECRVKRLYSIFLKQKNQNVSLDEIFDLMALRIITSKVEDCYIILGFIHRNWVPIEDRFRDWVSYPKPNGYRSIQTTVHTRKGDKFEIQIRTEEMNQEAEYGSAAHWAYKEGVSANDKWIMRLKEFLENDQYFENPYELQELLKSEFKRDFIHVLTPKGDIKTMRKGSTSVDFAYAVHTEVGNQVNGAIINGKLSKLKTILKSGDVVEVITSKNTKPSRDWLNFVKTSKARSKILVWIKKNENEQLIADGKRIWEKFKKPFRKKFNGIDDEQSFRNNLVKIGFKSPDDFFSAISIKSMKTSRGLLRKLYPEAFKKPPKKLFSTDVSSNKQHSPLIEVEGMTGIETKLAKCCNPIKGEPIIAYITMKSEIKIHSEKCKFINTSAFKKEQFKTALWLATKSVQAVKLRVYGYNYNNMLTNIVDLAAAEKFELKSLERTETRKNTICIQLELEINDITQLKRYLTKLNLSSDIYSVLVS